MKTLRTRLFFSIFPLLVLVVGASTFFYYTRQRQRLFAEQLADKNRIINSTKLLIENFDLSLSIAEEKFEKKLFALLLETKKNLGEELYTLKDSTLQKEIDKIGLTIDWSILTSKNLIIKSSFKKDVNLDLDPILGRSDREMLNETRRTFLPTTTKASVEVNTGKIKKYVYLGLKNGYVLEFGIYFNEINVLTDLVEKSLTSIKNDFEDLKELDLYFAEGLNHSVDGKIKLDDKYRPLVKAVVNSQKDTLLKTDSATSYLSFLKMKESKFQESWLLKSSFSGDAFYKLLCDCLYEFFIVLLITIALMYFVLIKFIKHYTAPIDELVKKTDIEVSSTFKRQITLVHKNDVDQLRYNLDYLIQQLYTSNVTLERKIEERTSDLKTSNDQLKVLLNERDMLFKEVHHRVKNNLQLISSLLNIQSLKVEDNAVAYGAFQESKNRVSAIAMFHEKMYKSRQIEQLDICEFLIDLVKSICEGLPLEFTTKIKCNNVIVKTEAAVTVALIVNELIINSSKHGFKGNTVKPELEIDLVFSANVAELRYSDNGNGLPNSFNPNTSESLGMLILRSFCEKLGDGFHLQNKISGTGVLFTCKIDNAFIVK